MSWRAHRDVMGDTRYLLKNPGSEALESFFGFDMLLSFCIPRMFKVSHLSAVADKRAGRVEQNTKESDTPAVVARPRTASSRPYTGDEGGCVGGCSRRP